LYNIETDKDTTLLPNLSLMKLKEHDKADSLLIVLRAKDCRSSPALNLPIVHERLPPILIVDPVDDVHHHVLDAAGVDLPVLGPSDRNPGEVHVKYAANGARELHELLIVRLNRVEYVQ
jgi:hypothetical protein